MATPLSLRFQWSRALHCIVIREYDGREFVAPADGLVEAWEPPDAGSRIADLPGRLAELRWPIPSSRLASLAEEFGVFLDSMVEGGRSDLYHAASADTLRFGVFEFQVALELRKALDEQRAASRRERARSRRRKRSPAPDPAPALVAREWWKPAAPSTAPGERFLLRKDRSVWQLVVAAPPGLEGVNPSHLAPEAGFVFQRGTEAGRPVFFLYDLSPSPSREKTEEEAKEALLRAFSNAALARGIRLQLGDTGVEVVLMSPIDAAWFELAQRPVLLRCERCGRVSPRNPRLKREQRYCGDACRKYASAQRVSARKKTRGGNPRARKGEE